MNEKRLKVLKMISQDMENDAKALDGQPFTGRTMGTQFGKNCAAIQALANIMIEEAS